MMKYIFRSLNQIYYLIYTSIILITILGYFLNLNNLLSVNIDKTTEIVFLSAQIIISAFAVLYFGYFFFEITKIKAITDIVKKEAAFLKLAKFRLYFIGVSLLAAVVCFYLVRSEIVLYQIAISSVLLLLCKPNESKIVDILSQD
ncbi:MAG: hypothetical protein ACOYM7_04875 [Paludibacter sp.]